MDTTSILHLDKNATLFFDDLEILQLIPKLSEEAFVEFCLANPKLKVEQDKHSNIIIYPSSCFNTGNYESEIGADLGIWN